MSDTCPYHSGIQAEIKAICAKMELQFKANEKAIDVARSEMDRRLEGMNEFRAQLSQQAQTFISRTELRLEIDKIINRILMLEKSSNYSQGSRHWSDYVVMAIISGAIVGLAKLIL